jgi:guanine deaminase
VLDYHATPLMSLRMKACTDLLETLFVFTMLGDDRAIKSTYIMGNLIYQREKLWTYTLPNG